MIYIYIIPSRVNWIKIKSTLAAKTLKRKISFSGKSYTHTRNHTRPKEKKFSNESSFLFFPIEFNQLLI